ncbi:MAG: ABC transporter permease [Bryobacteraceae bacterium]
MTKPDMAPQARETGRRPALSAFASWWLDSKLGVRMLCKHPGLALVEVFGIAVAVAIATGSFSVIYGTFLNPSLSLPQAGRLVSIELWDSAASKPERRILRDFHLWRDALQSVRELSAFRTTTPNWIVPGAQPESVSVASITASGFSAARVQPLIGRLLTAADEREGAPFVIVIAENVWRNRFASDPAILDRTIQLGRTTHSIVGVMPDGFAFPVNHRFWVPLRAGRVPPDPLAGPELMIFGRLAPGATLQTAQAELSAIGQRAALALPDFYGQLNPRVMPYPNPFVGLHGTKDVTGLHVFNGIVSMLLILVCLNVAILVYTRTAMRQSEIALRTALGASRGRIVAQLFVEALVLSAAGAVAGVAISALALRQAAAATLGIAAELPFWVSFNLSLESVLYAAALSVVAAAIVGVGPAIQATGRRVYAGARITSAGSGIRLGRTWTILVVAQVAFAVALLPAALFNAWKNLQVETVDPGFAADRFLTAQLGMDSDQPTGAAPPDVTRAFAIRHAELMRRIEADPRISGATFAMAVPGDEPAAAIEAQQAAALPPGTSGYRVRFNRVDAGFFQTLGVPILAGRGFEPAAASASRAVIVSQSLAQTIFGGNALGRRIRYAGAGAEGADSNPWHEIVGIVKDFPSGVSPGMNDSPLRLYHAIAAGGANPVNIALRVRDGDPAAFGRRLPELAARLDPALHLRGIVPMEDALRKEQWLRRMEALVLAAIALSVLLLSSAGVYALMSFTVSQRRKEIGIRIALGAGRSRILTGIFARALRQLAFGAALGALAAAALDKASGDDLLRGNASIVLPAVMLLMMAVGLAAAMGPARRCLSIEPTEALREQ